MLVSSNYLLKDAKVNHYAFPHFNYWDSNSIRAEIAAAESLNLTGYFSLGRKAFSGNWR